MNLLDLKLHSLECHSIQALKNDPEAEKFLSILHVPEEIISNLYLFTIPSVKDNLYRLHYGYLQEQNPYRQLPFSYDDWLLAYLAAENRGWGVVSYDHHLTYEIRKYLDYDAFFPEDMHELPAASMILLDTNIILHFVDHKQQKKREVISMFADNASITFLISENILQELGRVYQKKFSLDRKQIKIEQYPSGEENHVEPKEDVIKMYIDNFSRFESGKQRRLRKKRKNFPRSRTKYYSKWSKCLN